MNIVKFYLVKVRFWSSSIFHILPPIFLSLSLGLHPLSHWATYVLSFAITKKAGSHSIKNVKFYLHNLSRHIRWLLWLSGNVVAQNLVPSRLVCNCTDIDFCHLNFASFSFILLLFFVVVHWYRQNENEMMKKGGSKDCTQHYSLLSKNGIKIISIVGKLLHSNNWCCKRWFHIFTEIKVF